MAMSTRRLVTEFCSCSPAAFCRSKSMVVQIPSWLRRNNVNLVLNASPAVYNNFAIAVRASQVVVVDLFDTAEADDVPGLETFVFIGLLFELIGTNLADVAKHVGQHTVLSLAPLRLLFNAWF